MRYGGLAISLALIGASASAVGAETPGRQLLKLDAGASTAVAGADVTADAPSMVLVSVSSEFATVAVIAGRVREGGVIAGPGEAIILPLDGGKARRFGYDARRLAATMPPQWAGDTAAALDGIAARQRRARFWGRLEPVNLNASAPVAPALEGVRASYLGNAAIVALRREAKGDGKMLATLTANKFAAALAAGDDQTVADLLDPKPFTDTKVATRDWQASRFAFAHGLGKDEAMRSALAGNTPVAEPPNPLWFVVNGYRLKLVQRDRALFVEALEPQS